MKEKKSDKLNPKYFVTSGFERDENGIIVIDEDWRERIRNCNNSIDPKKNPPARTRKPEDDR